MATYTPATLSALLKGLNLSDETPNHADILKHANNVLKTNRSHPEALHTKAVALLHLDRFEDVVKALEENPIEEAKFELAYALYKSGKWEKAEQVAREARGKVQGLGAERVRRGLGHVEAQAAHRSENFNHAIEIYRDLIQEGKELVENEDYDLKVNRNATEAQMVWSGLALGKRKITGEELAQFETTYNAACIHIARNEFPQALILLKKARDLCADMGLSPEDLKDEVAPVIAQQVYALLKLGRVSEAEKAVQELDLKTLSDSSLKYIVSNNSIPIKFHSTPNPHLALRLFDATVSEPFSQATVKPYQFQTRVLSRNRFDLDLQVGKYDEVSNGVSKSQDAAKSAYASAAKSGGKSPKETLEEVKKALGTDAGKADIALGLYAMQLQMGLNNITGAVETAEALLEELGKKEGGEGRYPPALVGLLVALYRRQGRKKAPKQLDEAAQYWKDQPKPNESLVLSSTLHSLTSQSPASLTSAGSLLSSINPSTTSLPPQILSAGLVAAYATTNPSLAKSHLASLPPIDSLLKGIDVDALEAAGVYTPSKKRSADEAAEGSKAKKAKASRVLVKKKRVRKSRLPKDYVEGKEVDKERWLPLRERSYYKPPKGTKKGKKKNVAQGGITQGGKVEEEKDQTAPEVPAAKTAGAGGGGGGGQAKKKKKKGGKW